MRTTVGRASLSPWRSGENYIDITYDSEFKLAARCLTGLWYFWEAPYSWEIPVDAPEGTGTIATWSCLVCWNLRDLSSRFSSTGRTQETR